ncbi:MAG: CDP-diacylglycerol--serine O-phosphatidyltransferase, partial [Balneolaceae bacterium]
YELSIFGMLLSALPALCGAVRLARYNVDTRVAYIDYFRGLPIPGQAIMLAGFTLTFHAGWIFFETMRFGVSTILVPLVVMVSFLMVSTIPFDKLPPFDRESFRYKKARFIQFALYMLLILVFQEYGLMLVFGFYVLKGLLTGGRLFWNDRFGNGEHFVRQN